MNSKLAAWIVTAFAVGACLLLWRYNQGLEAEAAAAYAKYQQDSVAWSKVQKQYAEEAAVLRADSAALYTELRGARRAASIGAAALREAVTQVEDDSTRKLIEHAFNEVLRAGAACDAALTNCEQRAELARGALALAETQIVRRDSTIAALREAARPSLFRDLWRARMVVAPVLILLIVATIK